MNTTERMEPVLWEGKLQAVWQRCRHAVLYVFFGVLTTLVNLAVYWLALEKMSLPNVPASIIAWLVAVLTAFVTNKLWVFESRGKGRQETFRELCKFIYCRLATGMIDVSIMYVGVDLLSGPPVPLKALADVIVTILNYAASRWLVFHYQSKTAKRKIR